MIDNFENILCHQFEELLTDYLDGSLEKEPRRAMAAHALRCPVCHDLLNEVKANVNACQNFDFARYDPPTASLEARILQMTMPETALSCQEFEELLTDYLDGFLPASLFHRWERHATLCTHCTDLPGEVVRSIGTCYTFKADELMVPENLHERILQATLGTTQAAKVRMKFIEQLKQKFEDLMKSLVSPVLTPQFASVAMMLLMAFVIFTNANFADGSIKGVYQKGVQLAAQTYEQSASAVETGLSKSLNLNEQPHEEIVSPPVTDESKGDK